MVEGESSCFYHPQKKAVCPARDAAAFYARCAIANYTASITVPRAWRRAAARAKSRTSKTSACATTASRSSLAVLPMLVFYFTIITAPDSLFVALRYWNAPLSIVRRTRIRYVLALILATLQFVGWGRPLFPPPSKKFHG